MSFRHFLTIGLLDHEALRERRLVTRGPLTQALLSLLESHHESGLETIEVTSDYIRCSWYAPWLDHRAVEFAIAALDLGFDVAEVHSASLIERDDLVASLTR